MAIRARLVFNVDDVARLITVKYYGDIDGQTVLNSLEQHLKTLDAPWTYDSLFDMRRFEGFIVLDDLAGLARLWNQIARGRDSGRLTAFVSADPLVHARQKAYESGLPTRTIGIFNELSEALDWIKAARNADNPKLAS